VTADKREIPGRRRELGNDFRRVPHEGRVHNLDRFRNRLIAGMKILNRWP
jgi:hypothetical protein